jgi:hypothetical protein
MPIRPPNRTAMNNPQRFALILSKIIEELIDETTGIRERKEMSTCYFVDSNPQSFSGDASLEIDRKESIIATSYHMDWDIGPAIERAGLAKHDVGLRALLRLALFDDFRGDIVKKVRREVESRAVAFDSSPVAPTRAAAASSSPSWRKPGIGPLARARLTASMMIGSV